MASELFIFVDDDNILGPWDGTPGHPYDSIQNAINVSPPNTTIYIHNGTYYESLTINKNVTLIGENPYYTCIDSSGSERGILLNSNNITITNCTITNAEKGIEIRGHYCTISDCTITQTSVGLYLINTTSNCSIYHNNCIGNDQHAYDNGSNFWYQNGQGNYWDDYTGKDSNFDNFGDTPYIIPGGDNTDKYPYIYPITLIPIVNFTFTPSNPYTVDMIMFFDNSIDKDGEISKWYWNFGDGNSSTEQNPLHQYSDNGVYNVTLLTTDNFNVSNSTTKEVSISNVKPFVNFTYNPHLPTDMISVQFTDSSVDLDGFLVSWYWDFGDGNYSTEIQPTHLFYNNGEYIITLNVTDDDGDRGTTQQSIIILNVPPVASFSYTYKNISNNSMITFSDNSLDYDGYIVSHLWDFGDGTTSPDSTPTHHYNFDGTYKVSLTVMDDDGDTDVTTDFLNIRLNDENRDDAQSMVIYSVYIVIFIIMISMVFILKKKYE